MQVLYIIPHNYSQFCCLLDLNPQPLSYVSTHIPPDKSKWVFQTEQEFWSGFFLLWQELVCAYLYFCVCLSWSVNDHDSLSHNHLDPRSLAHTYLSPT